MSLFIIFIIWYLIIGKNNPKVYDKIGNKIGKIFGALILISIFSSFLPHIFALSFGLIGICFALLPFWLVYKIFFGKKNSRSSGQEGRRDRENAYRNAYSNTSSQTTGLTKSVAKRIKIVKSFNNKNELNLTESEIKRIVDASYMSWQWEGEIFAMTQKYDSSYEWYKGSTGWLRVFLRVYPVNSVSSDFEMQRQIALDTFERTFKEIDATKYDSVENYLKDINDRFFTAFDETTFMIAFRFLQFNGRTCVLPGTRVIKNESEIEHLMHEYDGIENASLDNNRKIRQ